MTQHSTTINIIPEAPSDPNRFLKTACNKHEQHSPVLAQYDPEADVLDASLGRVEPARVRSRLEARVEVDRLRKHNNVQTIQHESVVVFSK